MSDIVDKWWMGQVARVPCVLCVHMGLGPTPAQVHHLKFERGAADRAPDVMSIAVCPEHHTGPTGIHTLKERGLYRMYGLSELDLLAMTIKAVARLVRNA